MELRGGVVRLDLGTSNMPGWPLQKKTDSENSLPDSCREPDRDVDLPPSICLNDAGAWERIARLLDRRELGLNAYVAKPVEAGHSEVGGPVSYQGALGRGESSGSCYPH